MIPEFGAVSDRHPSRTDLEGFMLGRLSQRECRRVILHLLPGCPLCQEVTADLWFAGAREGGAAEAGHLQRWRYEGAVERVFERVRSARAGLEAERVAARMALQELEACAAHAADTADRWPALAEADLRCRTWGFCELLLGSAEAHPDPREAGRRAALATVLVRKIDRSVHPAVFVEELSARAWGALADARRRAGDLAAAIEALQLAESHLVLGTGDRLEKARLLERKAALRFAQEEPEAAARLLGRVILLYRRAGQWDQVGRILAGLSRLREASVTGMVTVPLRRRFLGLAVDLVRLMRLVRNVSGRLRR